MYTYQITSKRVQQINFCFVGRPTLVWPAEDEKGLDEKVLAVPDKDPRFNHMKSLRDVPEHVLREITNFFEVKRLK